jgi:hypothetical protein
MKFHNSSPEDFTFTWDSVPYTVEAGETILLQTYLAVHAAKHLSDREMNRDGLEPLTWASHRKTYMNKYLVIDTEVEETETMNKLEVEQKVVEAEVKRKGRPKGSKNKPKKVEKKVEKVEEEFED